MTLIFQKKQQHTASPTSSRRRNRPLEATIREIRQTADMLEQAADDLRQWVKDSSMANHVDTQHVDMASNLHFDPRVALLLEVIKGADERVNACIEQHERSVDSCASMLDLMAQRLRLTCRRKHR